MRPLVSYKDIADRHGHEPALKVLREMEKKAQIDSVSVAGSDPDSRFTRALKILQELQAKMENP